MRIAQIAPLAERVPPKKYGGTERVIHALTEELVRRGHDVTLFASGDSITSAKLVSVHPRNLREARLKNIYTANAWLFHNIGLAYSRQSEFDIIHDHNGIYGLATANIASTPSVITMHGPFNLEDRKIFRALRKPWVTSISKSQVLSVADLHHAGTVYNGLSMEHFPFSATHDGYLLFAGRISMEKGVHFAIEAAQMLDLPLIIAAKLEPTDRAYWREYIEPSLSDTIRWIGEVDEEERNRLMSRAMAFLHPVTWREPFGLTLIEAMACGCPVIGFNKGSIPEIIAHGKTGFVVTDLDEMVDAIDALASIDRTACRVRALSNFSATTMTDGYEAVYRSIQEGKL
ncbi:MAG: glycosyltransferase family 4 protein [bacterium]|nr:glycosyltransferase family 4 protein [bacterium]